MQDLVLVRVASPIGLEGKDGGEPQVTCLIEFQRWRMREAPRTLSRPIAIFWKMLVRAFFVKVLTLSDSTPKRNMLYSFCQKANPTLVNERRFEIDFLYSSQYKEKRERA